MGEIERCRICERPNLLTVLSLHEQYLTGVFPCTRGEPITKGPLELVWCTDCGLLQLKHSYDPDEMYGENYGYRSGLNASMVAHLAEKARALVAMAKIEADDVVLDIGSNDATLLRAMPDEARRIGIDPTGTKFAEHYGGLELIPEFFSADAVEPALAGSKPRLVTSIAMFYDLESPPAFVRDIARILADDGIWHFEQSYMPSMLRTTSYDTICHEHLEFYSFGIVKKLLEDCGLKVLEVEMNDTNGGSFAVTASKAQAPYTPNFPVIDWLLRQEDVMGLDTPAPFRDFERRIFEHRSQLLELIQAIVSSGKTILGYGASTKGNVLLQFCNITEELIPAIAEVNEDKFGCFTPGTEIPIVSEAEARAMDPDYYLVFPWHFKHAVLQRERDFRARGGKFIFPLPEITIV
jgi:C-methyltransferase-like protein/putative zinc binding protein/methyltransferase family protein